MPLLAPVTRIARGSRMNWLPLDCCDGYSAARGGSAPQDGFGPMQPVASMTGFARLDGDVKGLGFAWELRSVNHRGLDLRLRLPPGFEGLEPRLREAIGARLTGGSVAMQLTVAQPAGQTRFRVNT